MVATLRIWDGEKTIFDRGAHYVIPLYQRDYAWKDKEIEQLIDDVYGIGISENYYIGSLIVSRVKGKNETYEVVDGQQRLTTLFLLLQYLAIEGVLNGKVRQTLSFDCRTNSNYTLSNIQKVLMEKNSLDDKKIELPILNGIRVIRQKFTSDNNLNIYNFVSRLQRVILYRIEVPDNTDLNRYFEIMNTRGEQLEQHDILKAQLMGYLRNRSEQEFFARVWNACSDMTGYVQMHFSPKEREEIFGGGWNGCPAEEWEDYENCLEVVENTGRKTSIKKIIEPEFKVDRVDGMLDDGTHVRFDSIIDFPYFLLHVLRVFFKIYYPQRNMPFGDLLDDKKLLDDFDKVITRETSKGDFSRRFIVHLLRTRYLFDMFLIKREYTKDDNEGKWSLKGLFTSGQGSQKKAYYSNTKLNKPNERKKTYELRHQECLMIQSALRVSYTSPKIMHWITKLLLWLFGDTAVSDFINEAENIAIQATENFLKEGNYKLGVKTPHVVFNFLDYLIWKHDKNKYSDFEFEFRNSVEHWYPQNPSDGSFESWDDKDTFGNLCIISRSVNSKFSNLSPASKMKSYEKMVKKGSLKLRIMGDIIDEGAKGANEKWIKFQCKEHEEKMIELLREASGKLD